uniref:(California timema) hypothetical protein n=1 Tax=Timema californicum TaxID=61474 RepID=A0A7R9P4T2_TIMCA|nr:unnamed protein product [Timema californicum]
MTDTRRRVKLYALNAERQWDDRGTGHVSSSYVDRLKGISLLVRAEADGALLLESKIQPDTAYQKQQDTLIVWSEGDNFDLALSFQEKAGCDEIWEKICQVQGKDPSVDITQDIVEESEDERFDDMSDSGPIELPPCELSRLEEINEAADCWTKMANEKQVSMASEQTHAAAEEIVTLTSSSVSTLCAKLTRRDDVWCVDSGATTHMCRDKNSFLELTPTISQKLVASSLATAMRKEKLAVALENDGYIRKLLNLFHMCEDLENSEGLHCLYETFKNIFLLNKNALFEVMFCEETIFDVVGCLEYDPSSPSPKRHRQYLKQLARFKEVIPINNPELLAKIHQTYRVQYIQDVVLPTPSVFEDNMLSTLSSFIFFNKVEIVTLIQEDEKFLNELFSQLTDDATDDHKRRELVLFLKEFCNFSQNLQPQAKETFYKTLSSLGILPALEITLAADDAQTKTASIDILTYIVEFSPSVVRDYTLQQINNTDEVKEGFGNQINLCRDRGLNPGHSAQKSDTLPLDHQDQMLINVVIEQMICDTDPELGGAVQLMGILRILLDPENMLTSTNKSEKTDFLNYFYKHSVHILIAPLLANTAEERPAKEDYQTVQLLSLILELLSFCVEHHTYHIKNCILNKDLLRRILVLMKCRHKFLVLCALRFMRKIISLKDEFYNRYIIKGNLFHPVIDAFIQNNARYNLLDSAILELFEFIKLVRSCVALFTLLPDEFR